MSKGHCREVIGIRMTPEENIILGNMMRAEGWENITGFCKRKIFGKDPEVLFKNHQKRHAEEADPKYFGLELRDACYYLAEVYMKVEARYNKDMQQLYREYGFDQNKWEKRAAKYFREFKRRQYEMFKVITQIAKVLNIEKYFEMEFQKIDYDAETATEEERQAFGALMKKELAAHGEQY